jgi:hypothetical protein
LFWTQSAFSEKISSELQALKELFKESEKIQGASSKGILLTSTCESLDF